MILIMIIDNGYDNDCFLTASPVCPGLPLSPGRPRVPYQKETISLPGNHRPTASL